MSGWACGDRVDGTRPPLVAESGEWWWWSDTVPEVTGVVRKGEGTWGFQILRFTLARSGIELNTVQS